MATVHQLPHGVAKLISSTQVINSISSVVKELVENALDAGATSIDIKLERNGLDKIEVRDNGCGINTTDIYNVCLPSYTSKIYAFEDLDQLQSYGFRGEALNSLCAVSLLSIITKTETDAVASTYVYDNNGTVRDTKPSHHLTGTTVCVTNLFRNVPVRKQFYESSKKGSDELKKIEKIVKLLSIIHPKLRIILAHNKCLIWQKTGTSTLRQSLMQIYTSNVIKNLEDVSCTVGEMTLEALVVKRECILSVICQPISDAILFYVNQRPVKDKKLEKLVLEEMTHLYGSTLPANKCPLTLISIKLPPESLDVNLEPNKTKVFIKNHENILKEIREQLMVHFYRQPVISDTGLSQTEDQEHPSKKRKLNEQSNSYTTNGPTQEPRLNVADITPASAPLRNELDDISTSLFDESMGFDGTDNAEMVLENTQVLGSLNGYNKGPVPDDPCATNELDGISCEDLFDNLSQPANRHAETSTQNESSEHTKRQNSCSLMQNDDLSMVEISEHEAAQKIIPRSSSSPDSAESPAVISYTNTPHQVNEQSLVEDVLSNTPRKEVVNEIATLSQWSRGHAFVNNKPLPSGAIVLDKESVKSKTAPEPKKEIRDESQEEDVNRSVSSQMGRKDMAGFTNFSREIRSEIIKNAPGISFTRVAHELATRWRHLQDDEKNKYKELASKPKTSKLPPPDSKPRPLLKKKTYSLDISMKDIVEKLQFPWSLRSRVGVKHITLIGSFDGKSKWLYKIGAQIKSVNVPHLQENVLLHRHMCNSNLPLRELEEPVQITDETLGKELWSYLLSLDRSFDSDTNTVIITDFRITKNGFKISVKEVFPSEFEVFVTAAAKDSSFHVIENLIETLKLANQFTDLEQCRPAPVQEILLKTVIEDCQEKARLEDTSEIRMLIQYFTQCMSERKICSHQDPIVVNLHQF